MVARLVIIVFLLIVMLVLMRYWRRKLGDSHTATSARNKNNHPIKSKGQLVRDEETGQYHIDPNDKS